MRRSAPRIDFNPEVGVWAPPRVPSIIVGRLADYWVILPIRVESEANQRGHWTLRNKRRQDQLTTLLLVWRQIPYRPKRGQETPQAVVFTRYGARLLDKDNLAGSFKFLQDGIADLFGFDDGDSRVWFDYRQEKSKTYGVTIGVWI